MKARTTITVSCLLLLVFSMILSACGPKATPTPEPNQEIAITKITENDIPDGQIEQIKLFNQCENNSPLKTTIQFSETNTDKTQKELVISGEVGIEADIPELAKFKLQGAVQERFAAEKQAVKAKEETLEIEVPGGSQKEYTIIWNEIRRRGTIEYTEAGTQKFANYSYRLGVELASSKVKDISCLFTVTPSPTVEIPTETPTPITNLTPEPPVWAEKTIQDGCIFSKTWKVDSTDANALGNAAIDQNDGCYALGSLGISATSSGALRLYEDDKRHSVISGIYTPITDNSTIEFTINVNYMYIVYPDNPVYISFAVAPASDPIADKSAARFKLQVESSQEKPIIFFLLADANEFVGSKIPTQHYEYGRTYKIRLEVTNGVMSVYINGVKMDEGLDVPDGSKVFYVGYNLPIIGGIDLNITNIEINGVPR